MRNINNYHPSRYNTHKYQLIEPGIYKIDDRFVTSLSFVQEPDLGEGCSAAYISQYPLEDVLERFCVFVSNFYPGRNTPCSEVCYLEFASKDIADIRNLRSIIGMRVYNRICSENPNRVALIIESA